MYCNKCGVTLPEGSIFCSKCGAKLSSNNDEDSSMKDLSVKCGGKLSTYLCCECIHFKWVNEKKHETLCTKYNIEGILVPREEAGGHDELDERDRRIKKGFKCLDEENNEKAAKHFLKAISISPTGDAYFGLACCSSRAKDYDEAINLLNEAKELYEEEGDRQGIKACKNAISDIQSTVKLKKENMDGLLNLGANLIAKLLS